MKKINKNSYIFIDFDGVILDTEVRLEYMKGDRTWEEFSPTVDWTKLIKESEEIESSIENLKEIEKTYKNVFILSFIFIIALKMFVELLSGWLYITLKTLKKIEKKDTVRRCLIDFEKN